MIGQTLSHFKITAKLGEGGMGEVYRAIDTELGREVAIKILPSEFTRDVQRLARFEREAQILAQLNHQNIAGIYEVGTAESEPVTRFLAMELAAGETLAAQLQRGSLPIDDALDVAAQIAEGLEMAHECGIVHRDLKPANVMVDSDGMVKILDFGLATSSEVKASSETVPDSISPTFVEGMTEVGTVLGTPAYMSPEQAKGKTTDKRTDIWAFGCILFEMLNGRRLFEGGNPHEVLAEVLTKSPDLDDLPATVSPTLQTLLSRCIERDPRNRLRDVGEARIALEMERAAEPSTSESGKAVATVPDRTRWAPWLAAAGLGLLGLLIGFKWPDTSSDPYRLVQSSLMPPTETRLRPGESFSISPDGTQLAMIVRDPEGVNQLWVRPLASLEARELPNTASAWQPFWSPDSREIAFFADGKLKRISATGGTVRIVTEVTNPRGGTWNRDGEIVYAERRVGLFRVSAAGGEPSSLTLIDQATGELEHRWPTFLPDGQTLLFLVQTGEPGSVDDQSRIEALESNGTRREIVRVNSSARYSPTGHILFWREDMLYALDFDPKRLETTGDPRAVASDVAFTSNEWAAFDVSNEGELIFRRALAKEWRLEWRDRAGRLLAQAAPDGEYLFLELSPDGQKIAYADDLIVWARDLERGTTNRFSFDEVDQFSPVWSHDGEWLAYTVDKRGAGRELRRRRTDGSGEEEILFESQETGFRRASWSPDGRSIALEESGAIKLLDLDSGSARVLVDTPGQDLLPGFSPDGKWLAYSSNESGRYEVYVVPVNAEGKWQVSSRGGTEPEWSPSGTELFFRGLNDELRVASVDSGTPTFSIPETLFVIQRAAQGTSFETGPDGRILVRVKPSGGESTGLALVTDWPGLLNSPRPSPRGD